MRTRVPARRRPAGDGGAAVAEWVMVSALLTLLFAGLLQLALALHVRATLVDCVGEGARYGALADRTPADGAARARELIDSALSSRFAGDVTAGYATVGSLEVVEVTASAPLPVLGPFGPPEVLVVRGHGLVERTP